MSSSTPIGNFFDAMVADCHPMGISPVFDLSRDGVEYLLTKHVVSASQQCPSLKKKRVSPHHTAAMELLQY